MMEMKLPDRLEHVIMEQFQEKSVSNLNQFSKLMQHATQTAYLCQKMSVTDRLPDEDAENRFLQNVQILFDFQYDKKRREAKTSETPFEYVCYLEDRNDVNVDSDGDPEESYVPWQKLVYNP